jgi:hypothetical protein
MKLVLFRAASPQFVRTAGGVLSNWPMLTANSEIVLASNQRRSGVQDEG